MPRFKKPSRARPRAQPDQEPFYSPSRGKKLRQRLKAAAQRITDQIKENRATRG